LENGKFARCFVIGAVLLLLWLLLVVVVVVVVVTVEPRTRRILEPGTTGTVSILYSAYLSLRSSAQKSDTGELVESF
jgi:hypothetical protein